MTIYKTPNREIEVTLNEGTSIPTPSNSILLIGLRNILPGTDTYFKPLVNKPGFPFVENYHIYELPNFTSGASALSYMQSLGFSVSYGVEGSTRLSNPSAATVNSDNSVTLTFSGTQVEAEGWSEFALNNPNVTSTFTQTTSGAVGSSISYSSDSSKNTVSVTLASVSGTFDTTNGIDVVYIDSSIQVPNQAKTDDICCQVWSVFEDLNNSQPQIQNVQVPQIYFSIVPTASTPTGNFGPTSADITMSTFGVEAPIVSGTTVDIYFASEIPTNYFLIPKEGGANITLAQTEAGAIGTVERTLPGSMGPAGSLVGVRLVNVTGTFNNEDHFTLKLDAGKDIFSHIGNTELGYINCPYEINSTTDVDITYKEFFDNVKALNTPYQVMNNHFVVFGGIANLTLTRELALQLPEINSQYFIGSFYPYASSKSPALRASQVSASVLALNAQSGTPFNPINNATSLGIYSNLTKNQQIEVGVGSQSEQVFQRGWTPISVNQEGLPYIVRAVTTLLSLSPGLKDIEYFPVSTWQVISEWKKAVYLLTIQPFYTNARTTPFVQLALVEGVRALAMTFAQLGMFENINRTTLKEITVSVSKTDPSQLIIHTPVTVVPELNSIKVEVDVESALDINVLTV